jgi:hypothetical protein
VTGELPPRTAGLDSSIDSNVNDVEWATPALYLRATDGRIVDVVAAPASTRSPLRPTDVPPKLAADPALTAALSETKDQRRNEVIQRLATFRRASRTSRT